ncbi:hypothetical protein ATM97_07185 [Nocardia sp. MH4]|uniref:hypothetical protein n=1 Tax=Nocardia sp. MH4 TaxID=1768677 RepID=UPI001C4ECD2D|nr:hypothetical protein [Nocardia sp. MH4]MBW0270795.1 hypothetical protein [Nocardia sp. MH4]
MGIMKDLKNIEGSAAAMSAKSSADDARMLVLVQLMQMNWPTLDKQAASIWVDKWLQKNGLGGR